MKKIMIVSRCSKRRDTLGLIGVLLATFEKLDKKKFHVTLLDTNFFERNHNPSDYNVDCYQSVITKPFDGLIRFIPRIRAICAERRAVGTFRELLNREHFDFVVVYEVPTYAEELVKIAHKSGAKILFEPFGSDILFVSDRIKKKLRKAFAEVDGVCGRTKSNVLIAAHEVFRVPDYKIKEQQEVVSGVIRLKKQRGKLSRLEMHKEIGIPYSNFNIVCGYSGRKTHRHRSIIDALTQIKDVLPSGYQIIFPMTYGAGAHHEVIIDYASQLKTVCDEAGLNAIFMTDFKTYEQIAYLHLITDLFIEIQPTDNGNAFMIEALYAQNQIVTGRWLNYQRFEQFGVPYYLIDTPEDLPIMLRDIFTNKIKRAIVPQALIDYFDIPEGYDKSTFWTNLFDTM